MTCKERCACSHTSMILNNLSLQQNRGRERRGYASCLQRHCRRGRRGPQQLLPPRRSERWELPYGQAQLQGAGTTRRCIPDPVWRPTLPTIWIPRVVCWKVCAINGQQLLQAFWFPEPGQLHHRSQLDKVRQPSWWRVKHHLRLVSLSSACCGCWVCGVQLSY